PSSSASGPSTTLQSGAIPTSETTCPFGAPERSASTGFFRTLIGAFLSASPRSKPPQKAYSPTDSRAQSPPRKPPATGNATTPPPPGPPPGRCPPFWPPVPPV